MRSPQLSILLPNYNHARFLPKCIESSLDQSFRDFELIVVDDASTDESWSLLEEYTRRDSRIRLHRNERNMGVNATLNRALALARGKYVHGASADDFIRPGYYEAAFAMFERYPQAAVCVGRTRLVRDFNPVPEFVPDMWANEPTYLTPNELARRMTGCGIPGPALWRREPFQQLGGYDPELRWHSDWFAIHVIAFRHGICFLPDEYTVVRLASDSYSNANARPPGAQEKALHHLLNRLRSPETRDVLPLFEASGVLRNFGNELVEAALTYDQPLNDLATVLKPHVAPLVPHLLHARSPALRAGAARFVALFGGEFLALDDALAVRENDPEPSVVAAAAAARRAFRADASSFTLMKRRLRKAVGRILRRLDRRSRPLLHDRLDHLEQLVVTLSQQQQDMRTELMGLLRSLGGRMDALAQDLDADASRRA